MIYIYRGLPGSGKNTHAEQQDADHILDSDSYFVDENGDYEFVPSEATKAHKECFRRYLQLLPEASSWDLLAVCNTNTTRAEYTPYVQAARAFGFEDEIRMFR